MKLHKKFILAATTLLFAAAIVVVVSAGSGTAASSPATATQSIGAASGAHHDCPCGGRAECAENCKKCPSFKDANNDGICDQRGDCPNHGKCGDNCGQGCQGKCQDRCRGDQGKCTPPAGGCRHGSR
jgi:hypothetical protein